MQLSLKDLSAGLCSNLASAVNVTYILFSSKVEISVDCAAVLLLSLFSSLLWIDGSKLPYSEFLLVTMEMDMLTIYSKFLLDTEGLTMKISPRNDISQ